MTGKIKHTKNALKEQRDALARFERYLPMLQLKKQQLQMEIINIENRIAQIKQQCDEILEKANEWIAVLNDGRDNAGCNFENIIKLEEILCEIANIAGIDIPIYKDCKIKKMDYSIWDTPPWYDEACKLVERLIRLYAEHKILEESRRKIYEELRVTTQRVNLFEKVKIPECRENIRVIKIFLGDEQTSSVARAKIAKEKIRRRMAEVGA